MEQTALSFLEWRWPEVYKEIPKEILHECFELEKEIIINAFNQGESLGDKRNYTGIIYYNEIFKKKINER